MNLSHHQQHQLRRIETGLLRSDPQLTAMLGVFGRLSAGRPCPLGADAHQAAKHPAGGFADREGDHRRGRSSRPVAQGGPRSSADLAVSGLHARLAAAGLPASAADQVVAGFRTCFHDRASQNDPTAIPASCRRIQRQVAAAPAPAAVKAAVASAVTAHALPLARKDDFSRSLQHTLLLWQVAAFLLSGLLVFALPKVKPSATLPGAG